MELLKQERFSNDPEKRWKVTMIYDDATSAFVRQCARVHAYVRMCVCAYVRKFVKKRLRKEIAYENEREREREIIRWLEKHRY